MSINFYGIGQSSHKSTIIGNMATLLNCKTSILCIENQFFRSCLPLEYVLKAAWTWRVHLPGQQRMRRQCHPLGPRRLPLRAQPVRSMTPCNNVSDTVSQTLPPPPTISSIQGQRGPAALCRNGRCPASQIRKKHIHYSTNKACVGQLILYIPASVCTCNTKF